MTTRVALSFGDALLHRLCLEHVRLEDGVAEFVQQMDLRRLQIVTGMAERNLTRAEFADLSVRRSGRDGVVISRPPPPTL